MSQDLVKSIRLDPNYKKFGRIVETIRSRVNLTDIQNEALGLHASRSSRNMYGEGRYSPSIIIDASLKDLSFRARLVEMRVKLDIEVSSLSEAMAAVKNHISTEYADEIQDEFKNVGERKNFVDRCVKNSNQFLSDSEAVISTLDHLIKDLDQGSFYLKNVIETLKVVAMGGKVI